MWAQVWHLSICMHMVLPVGELAEDGDEYLASLDIEELPEIITLADKDWDGVPLDVNEEGTSILEL